MDERIRTIIITSFRLFFNFKMSVYGLRPCDEEALSQLLLPFNTLDEYIKRLENFKSICDSNSDPKLHGGILDWVRLQVDWLREIKTTITKSDMKIVNMVFDGTIGRYHHDSIIDGIEFELNDTDRLFDSLRLMKCHITPQEIEYYISLQAARMRAGII